MRIHSTTVFFFYWKKIITHNKIIIEIYTNPHSNYLCCWCEKSEKRVTENITNVIYTKKYYIYDYYIGYISFINTSRQDECKTFQDYIL